MATTVKRSHDEDYYASSGCIQDMMEAMFSAKHVTDIATIEDEISFFEKLIDEGGTLSDPSFWHIFFIDRINEFKQRYKELTGKEYEKWQE
ncbi:MAG: hypothetical protein ACI38Q_07750 [Candidatus Bruticola sp.]